MSATLGTGGELERITGRRRIRRLAVPPGWEKQAVGRRLFFFPAGTLQRDDVQQLACDLAVKAGRSIVLTTDLRREETLSNVLQKETGFPVFNAREIEESKAAFVQQKQAIAVIANRYDGIDFPGEECRLLMIDRLPKRYKSPGAFPFEPGWL